MTPLLMAVMMFAQDDTEADAGLAVAAVAFMMQTINIRFVEGFGADKGGRCQQDAASQCDGSNR